MFNVGGNGISGGFEKLLNLNGVFSSSLLLRRSFRYDGDLLMIPNRTMHKVRRCEIQNLLDLFWEHCDHI